MPEIKIVDETGKKQTGKTAAASKKKTASQSKTSAKKTSSSSQLKLSAAEKKLVQNYRKCNALEKELISALTEKASGKLLDSKAFSTTAITELITNLMKD